MLFGLDSTIWPDYILCAGMMEIFLGFGGSDVWYKNLSGGAGQLTFNLTSQALTQDSYGCGIGTTIPALRAAGKTSS